MTSVHDHTEVRLAVPATPEFLRLARLTVAGVASRMGFTYDEVEDLRIAIDELCFALVGTKGREGKIELRYSLDDDDLMVEGRGTFSDQGPVVATLSPLSRQILAAVVDEHDLAAGERGPTFRLRKRRSAG
jgi:serine/threonine-protein kinase RsbW